MKKIIILIIVLLLGGYFYYYHAISSPLNKNGADAKFLITQGDGVKKIAKNLVDAQIIGSQFFFETYVWQKGIEKKFIAGEYIVNPKMSIMEIIKNLTGVGPLSNEKNITIIEGWNNKEIAAYLEKQGFGTGDDFLKLVNTNKYNANYGFLNDKSKTADLEGFLFPDTYRVFKDATQEDILMKMLNNFDRKLTDQMRADIAKQGRTIYEIVTMASVIEKEVRSADDMKIVSGVFWDRIKNGQALESCATLAYILGENKKQYSYADTRTESPYNTYVNRGLPPSPISNPGMNALSAAIYPTYTGYNYFLSDPATGKTIFSKTLNKHNANKAKYLK
ncbi:MAG: endolytic transglycosylase MltG [Patescibacteria group bacterium]|nr:endolytic transglycosylase MltG [Patescibacteria group bacterium]MDD4610373.1 endolytic transglycosylase MltG [Patescibacteria group bacterium]